MLSSTEDWARCVILDPRISPASRKSPQKWQEQPIRQIPNDLVAADGNDDVRETTRSRLLEVSEKPDDECGHTDAPKREDEPDRFHGGWSYDASARSGGVLRRILWVVLLEAYFWCSRALLLL
jgi:hypothetical protein